ncbi:PP2C family protein-serine/threonine phosphatase [Desulfoferrobacter suflitae]|uniref:PP2C family protein-serine/threonine phosphatase n=1 Tax=Desulfoferrobacter suflitae TaxID=2865782 RepID=UPI002164E830|nr:protein phosphatase 2C domain-containing protein [Desulfoferrobacter suflitae]MCK8604211.1 protein phosphatase 2C domain-containing protein [Desulfoferrobacter suflitae]
MNEEVNLLNLNAYSLTHRGMVRKTNEDRSLIQKFAGGDVLLAVADGMGGHAAGERAAQIAVESLNLIRPESPDIEDQLVERLLAARRMILDITAKDPALQGMGTTLTVALVGNGTVHWTHVGDSRLYLFRENELVQVTDDHTFPGHLVKEGEISREEARAHPLRSMLLSCIGCEQFEMDTGTFDIAAGDLLLLSTDGLHDGVPEQHIISILRSNTGLKQKLDALMDAALAAGGRDNITVVAAEL